MGRFVGMLFLIFLSAISGCKEKRSEFPQPRSGAVSGSFVKETRPLKIGDTKYRADFGTITVPENRSDSTSRLLDIPFVRIKSSSDHPAEPVFAFAGGPGMTNVSWDWNKASYFLRAHDFVVVGYRGVDGSTVLDCPEVRDAFKKTSRPLSSEWMMAIAHAWTASGERLRTAGIDLDRYTIPETIEDNESVRLALRYNRINLLSESYGTRIAYLYGLIHPECIRRSAMIGVNPPSRFVWDAAVTDSLLRYYSSLWMMDTSARRRCANLYASMIRILNHMPERWLIFPIVPEKVRIVSFVLLFQRETSAMVFDAFAAADKGDPSGLALMSLAYDYVIADMMVWGDLASKAVSADLDPTRDYSDSTSERNYPLGSPMTRALWGPLKFGKWPTRPLPAELRRTRRSNVETLLLSGDVDFSTPAIFAKRDLLPFLPKGKQVILSTCGHVNDIWNVNPANTRLILTSFIDKGTPNLSLNSYVPMNFTVKLGFPMIAKLGLGVGVLVIVVLITVPSLIVVRRRRRNTRGSARGTGDA